MKGFLIMKVYNNFALLIRFIRNSKKWVALGVIGMIIASLIISPVPYLIGYIIDEIILVNKDENEIVNMIALLIGLYIIRTIISVVYQYIFTKVQQNVLNEIRLAMISNIIDAPMCFINKKDKGYILGRIGEAQQIGSLFSPTILQNFIGLFELIFYLVIMVSLNIKLTLITLIIIPIYFVLSKESSKRITKSTVNLQEASAILNSQVFETLNGVEDIKLLNGKDSQLVKICSKLKTMAHSAVKQNTNFIKFVQSIILTNDIVTAIVLGVSGFLILKGEITVGIYTSFSLYIAKILSIIQSVGTLEITVKPICITIGRIKEFFDIDNENVGDYDNFNEPISSITFENISFKYSENSNSILNNFTYQINDGDKVLIKGCNGSGKTTLIKLVTGLYKPNTGKILINNYDSISLSKIDIRNKIGIVSQNVFLFKGTVSENILFGTNGKTKEDIIKLVEEFGLVTYFDRFSNGLDTEILQNGTGISGGQAQIVAFLRAAIRNKDVFILDEATSNLDEETRNILLDILEKKKTSKILIIISHQNNGLDFVNKVIDME